MKTIKNSVISLIAIAVLGGLLWWYFTPDKRVVHNPQTEAEQENPVVQNIPRPPLLPNLGELVGGSSSEGNSGQTGGQTTPKPGDTVVDVGDDTRLFVRPLGNRLFPDFRPTPRNVFLQSGGSRIEYENVRNSIINFELQYYTGVHLMQDASIGVGVGVSPLNIGPVSVGVSAYYIPKEEKFDFEANVSTRILNHASISVGVSLETRISVGLRYQF